MCIRFYTSFFFVLFIGMVVRSQNFNKEVEAKINIDSKGILTDIIFSAYNKTSIKKSLRYKALIVKNLSATSSKEQFEDEQYFVIEAGERKNISKTTLSLENKERTIIFVLLYEEDQVIGKDRIVINGFEGEDDIQPKVVQKDNLIETEKRKRSQDIDLMKGLVFENTKTKPGRDFYQMFYLAYQNNNINGNEMVKVDEVLAIGGNTQIKIYAGNELVVQFFLNPRSSYLKEMVDQSILRVNQYFIRNKAISQNTIQY